MVEGAERRSHEQEIWQILLAGPPTHVLRLGWQTALGSNYDILYLTLCFDFHGFHHDGLARAFTLRLWQAIQRNTKLTWRLCPASRGTATTEAAIFWLAAAFAFWREIDLGLEVRH